MLFSKERRFSRRSYGIWGCLVFKVYLLLTLSEDSGVNKMTTEEIRCRVTAVNELTESYADLLQAVRGTIKEAKATQKLWKAGDKSKLIKLGVALIVFPEPTPVSEAIGSVLVASGLVQSAIRRRSLHVEDIFKTFHSTMKEIRNTMNSI